MRIPLSTLLAAAVACFSAAAQPKPDYLTGAEVSPKRQVFLTMPVSNFPQHTAGPLTVTVQAPTTAGYGSGGLAPLNQTDVPYRVTVWLKNSAAQPVSGTVTAGVIDRWRVKPAEPVRFQIGPRGWTSHDFEVSFGKGTYNAHYPVRIKVEFTHEGRRYEALPVLVLKPQLPDPPGPEPELEWKPQPAPDRGALPLAKLPVRKVRYAAVDATPLSVAPRPSFESGQPVSFGSNLVCHLGVLPPARRQNVTAVTVEYPVQFSAAQKSKLVFVPAVSETLASSGAMFRVTALPFDAPAGAAGDTLWERRVNAVRGERTDVDLDRYVGKAIRLQFEATGEGTGNALWGDPAIVAGQPWPEAAFPPDQSRPHRVLGKAGDYEVRIWPGRRGALDLVVGFVAGTKQLLFRGFDVRVCGDALQEYRSLNELIEVKEEPGERYRARHRFRNWAGSFDLVSELWVEGEGLSAKFWLENIPAPRPWTMVYLESVATGPWSDKATHVYTGAGIVRREPKAFRTGTSSYAGYDFSNGVSLVQAVDTLPGQLVGNPARRIYTIDAPGNQTVTYLPSSSVWEAAKKWRARDGRRAAGGVSKLAGRFSLDLWHGRYRETTEALERAFRYGMTDLVIIFHNWSRWAYDYRLPDIYPPTEQFGTHDEFRNLVKFCKDHNVLFAPHDNYVDFYPDAEGFSYERIAFLQSGEPRTAWNNASHEAQSYRAIPERIRPLVERNLRLIKEDFAPNAYDTDVWGGAGNFEQWTSDGVFRPRTTTLDEVRSIMGWIRDYLGGAPQITEAAHDQYVGYVDGTQVNHGGIETNLSSVAADAERIPWRDFFDHDRLILLGAGYHERYSSLGVENHGMYSDDYTATVMLTGHTGQAFEVCSRNTVRQYWRVHGVSRALALKRMENVEFVSGDLHRQRISWEGGGEVYVNRGKTEWTVNGHVLPEYGFYARVPDGAGWVESCTEKRDGHIVEWSRSPNSYYVNARGQTADFDGVQTSDAFRLSLDGGGVQVTALPDGQAFPVRLQWARLPWKIAEPQRAEMLDEFGKIIGTTHLSREGQAIVLNYEPRAFAYRLR